MEKGLKQPHPATMHSSAQGSDLAVTKTGRSRSCMCIPVPVAAWLQTDLQEAPSLAEIELLSWRK